MQPHGLSTMMKPPKWNIVYILGVFRPSFQQTSWRGTVQSSCTILMMFCTHRPVCRNCAFSPWPPSPTICVWWQKCLTRLWPSLRKGQYKRRCPATLRIRLLFCYSSVLGSSCGRFSIWVDWDCWTSASKSPSSKVLLLGDFLCSSARPASTIGLVLSSSFTTLWYWSLVLLISSIAPFSW